MLIGDRDDRGLVQGVADFVGSGHRRRTSNSHSGSAGMGIRPNKEVLDLPGIRRTRGAFRREAAADMRRVSGKIVRPWIPRTHQSERRWTMLRITDAVVLEDREI